MARVGRDSALLAALAAGCDYEDAARSARISARTVRRRMADPAFRAQLSGLRAEALDRAAGHLADASTTAAETLRRLLNAESETVRLAASKAILELGPRLREMGELEARISALEGGAG